MSEVKEIECPACGGTAAGTGKLEYDERFNRTAEVYLCKSCGKKVMHFVGKPKNA